MLVAAYALRNGAPGGHGVPRPRSSCPSRDRATVATGSTRKGVNTQPTLSEFAAEWYDRQTVEGGRAGGGLAPKSREDLEWRLGRHLLPAFGAKRLDEIGVQDVDAYRLAKIREGLLSPSSINNTLTTLSSILELAVEYELIERNPAHGRRRRLRSPTPKRAWLDRADQIRSLLRAAGELDEAARSGPGQRRALVSVLLFAGLRIGEALRLRVDDLDLGRGTITVARAKTDAGLRTVNILPVLHQELATYAALRAGGLGETLFATSTGGPLGPSNVRRRILARAVERADATRREAGFDPLPPGLTPHALRRTFASLLFAVGESPPYVMAQMGHTSANLTLSVYAREMLRRDGEPERLRALVEGR